MTAKQLIPWRRLICRTTGSAAAALAPAVAMLLTSLALSPPLYAQSSSTIIFPPPTQPEAIAPQQPPLFTLPGSSDGAGTVQSDFNTTIIPRQAKPKAASNSPLADSQSSRINLVALLTDTGQAIEKGIVWRIYGLDRILSDGPKLIKTRKQARFSVDLPPGSYAVNAAYGRAHITRKITVAANTIKEERFVLNAGGLALKALSTAGTELTSGAVAYDIFSDERNQFGNRTRVIARAQPGTIYRLNAGIYYIVSTLGDANATVRADVSVEAGKLTRIAVTHTAARITLKLVARAGGEALADTRWHLATNEGVVVKESAGAIPTHILAAGSYVVSASHGEHTYRQKFQVTAGQDSEIEVLMQ